MHIYLVRHGKSLSRKGKNHIEALSVALSRAGRMQALVSGLYLKTQSIGRLFSSDVKRANETADIIGKVIKSKVNVDTRFGEFVVSKTLTEKIAFKELRSRKRTERKWGDDSDGESFDSSISRFMSALSSVATLGESKICVVCHELIIQNILLNFDARYNVNSIPKIYHGEVLVFNYKDGVMSVSNKGKFTRKLSVLLNSIIEKIF